MKWILGYLSCTVESSLYFRKSNLGLQVCINANMIGDIDGRKNTSRYIYILGGIAVSWILKLQKIVTLSTTKAKYVVVTKASKEMMRLQSFSEESGPKYEWSVLQYYDNQSVIYLVRNPIYHVRTKNIQVQYHFIRSTLKNGVLALKKIEGSLNPIDMLTKVMTIEKLELCTTSVGLLC